MPDPTPARRALAVCVLLLLVVLHVEFIALPRSIARWPALHQTLTANPDRGFPDYPLFLEGVRMHTKPGDRISVVVPAMNTDSYRYAYYRASYFLAGREVLPLYYRMVPHPQNLARADYLALWHSLPPRARIVWAGHGGVLLSRR